MKREINEDTLKQCRDIEIDCHDIKSCRRKKLCRNTSEHSRDRSWKIKMANHVEFVTTKILMLQHTVQRLTLQGMEIMSQQ